MNAGSLCTREVVFVRRDATILEAARLMRDHHVGSLVVMDDSGGREETVGIITDRDLVVSVLADNPDRLEGLSVGDVVARELVIARDDEDVFAVLERMRGHGIRRVPVLDRADRLQGILAFDDLVEWVTEQLQDLTRLVHNERRVERELHARH